MDHHAYPSQPILLGLLMAGVTFFPVRAPLSQSVSGLLVLGLTVWGSYWKEDLLAASSAVPTHCVHYVFIQVAWKSVFVVSPSVFDLHPCSGLQLLALLDSRGVRRRRAGLKYYVVTWVAWKSVFFVSPTVFDLHPCSCLQLLALLDLRGVRRCWAGWKFILV